MARTFITFIKSSATVITRAIVRSIREEIEESQARAARLRAARGVGGGGGARGDASAPSDISCEEARRILDVRQRPLCRREVIARFNHLYRVNTHSLYLRSKVFRAYQKLIKEYYKLHQNRIKLNDNEHEHDNENEKIKPIAEQKINKNTEIKCS